MERSGWLSYENRLVAILGLTFGIVFLDRNAASFLAPFIVQELHLTNTQVGLLAAVLSLSWAVSGYVVGLTSDKTGRRKAYLVASVLVFSVASFLSGLASSFLILLGARLLMGIAEGPVLPIAQSLVALESSPHRRGLNAGLMQNVCSALLGTTIAPIVLVALANSYGWRSAFFIAGVPGLIMALLVAKYLREPKVSAPTRPAATERIATDDVSLARLLLTRNVTLCTFIACLMVAWMVLGWTFLPLFYVNIRQFSTAQMSVLMGVMGICAAVCGFIVPALSDKFGRKPVVSFFCFLGALTPLAAIYYSGPIPMLAALVFIGWSAAGTFPVFMATIPSETISAKYLSTVISMVMGVGEIVGGVAAPTFSGMLADRHGLVLPIAIQVVCALTAGLLALFLKETAPAKVGAANAPVHRAVRHPAAS